MGYENQKSLTLKINELGIFLSPNTPSRVNHVSTDFEMYVFSCYKTPLTKCHR